jgi:hypothetical protein
MVNGNTYLINGAPQHCALCHAPFTIEDEHVKCWRGKDPAVLLLPRARRFRPGESPYGRRARWGESVMRRCDYCGGKLGLIVHRRWRLRFCKPACKNAYELRLRKQIRHRRRWLDTSRRLGRTSLTRRNVDGCINELKRVGKAGRP